MRAGFKEESVHDARHMARDALAGFALRRVVRVSGDSITVLGVTGETHLIRFVPVFQRGQVVVEICQMGGMATGAARTSHRAWRDLDRCAVA